MKERERCQNQVFKRVNYLTRWIADDCRQASCGNIAVSRTERGIPVCKKCLADPYRSLCK